MRKRYMSMPISSMVDCSTRATQQGNMFSYQWKHGTVFWFLVGFPN